MSILTKLFALSLSFMSMLGISIPLLAPIEAPPTVQIKHEVMQTPLTEVQLMKVLKDSHVVVFGNEPSDHRLAMAWAQVAFENGRGALTVNHNIGNTWMCAGNPYYVVGGNQKYRSFATFEDGAAAYWHTIKSCGPATRAFEWGSAKAAAEALKACNYFDADVDGYAAAMGSLYYNAKKLLPELKKIDGGKDGGSD
jgi:hypothetical protein